LKERGGFVLVVVLWVLAILTIVTLGFGDRVMLDAKASGYALDHTQAMLMARGAVQRGIVEVRNMVAKEALQPDDQRGGTHLGQDWARPKDILHDEEGKYFEGGESFKNDSVMYFIEDAERFVNINAGHEDLLENLPNMSRRTVKKIIIRRTKGVREDEGRALFHAPEELRYMRGGVDEEEWFGEDDEPGIRDLITTVGYSRRVNVNTASKHVLAAIPDLGEDGAEAIIGYRSGEDWEPGTGDDRGFANWKEIEERLGIRGDALQSIKRHCAFRSDFFIITGVATRQGGKVRATATAVVHRRGTSASIIAWRESAIGS